MRRPVCSALLAWVFVFATASPVDAKEPERPEKLRTSPDYANPYVEGGMIAVAGVGYMWKLHVLTLPQHRGELGPDAAHDYDEDADELSDITGAKVGLALTLGSGYLLELAHMAPAIEGLSDLWLGPYFLSMFEAAGISYVVNDILKRGIGRCRPMQWVDGVCTTESPAADGDYGDDDAFQAFPSGHVAGGAAIAGVQLWYALESEEPAPFRWAQFAVSEALVLTTMKLRVDAGAHSWSDVISSTLISHGIGIGVAALHGRQANSEPTAHLSFGPGGLVLAGRF